MYTADFLTVQHDTGLLLYDELVLRRQEESNGSMNLTMYALTVDNNISSQKVFSAIICHLLNKFILQSCTICIIV